jgi:hypothetical protein
MKNGKCPEKIKQIQFLYLLIMQVIYSKFEKDKTYEE